VENRRSAQISWSQCLDDVLPLRQQAARRRAERLVHRIHPYAIEKTDANTRALFGDRISIYDIERDVAGKSTVPIYYGAASLSSAWTAPICRSSTPSAGRSAKVMLKRILNKHGYPPHLQAGAVKTALAQAELLCAVWTVAV
jgi:hypothetical protein